MTSDKKNPKEPMEQEYAGSKEEATQANKEIQEAFYSDEETAGPSASPIPFVANNTAPLSTADDKKKKQ